MLKASRQYVAQLQSKQVRTYSLLSSNINTLFRKARKQLNFYNYDKEKTNTNPIL